MVLSSTTLIQAVNRVLLDVGEREVSNLNSPPAKKAKNYLQEAVRFLATVHDWEWMFSRVPSTGWVGDTFSVPNAQQIRGVSCLDSSGVSRDLQFVDVRQFDLASFQSYSIASSPSNRPTVYTIPTYQRIRVNPYPTDAIGQSRVYAYIIEDLVPPTLDTSFFPVPEKYMQLVIKKADYYMSIHHLEDANSAQFFDKDFQEMVIKYRVNEQKTPTGGFNMYRSRTRRYGGGY